jgi:hypothetical protein
MRKAIVAMGLLALIRLDAASAQQANCNRECLRDALMVYMNAVAANAPQEANLIVGFRQTENAVVTVPGKGTWQSVTALGDVQRQFLDPVTGQAAYFGLVDESGTPAVVTARVKVVNRRIAEAEWYIARKGQPGMQGGPAADGSGANLYDPANLRANPPPEERNVPSRERLSRESLLGVANSYFDAITTRNGEIMLSHPNCTRLENGVTVTGRPMPEGTTDFSYQGKTNCASGIGPGSRLNINFVAARQYPIVDEQQQVVMATGVFVRFPNAENRRNGLSEYFYIDNERIAKVYAAMFYPAPDQPVPNWPPYQGNYPLPADFGVAR